MRLIFAGTPQLAAEVLVELSKIHEVALVITREDSKVGRNREATQSPVAQAAGSLGLPILKANRVSEAQLEFIAEASAQLGVVVAFGAILPTAALKIVDWWNVHFSLLPSWRGATPAQHAILHGYGGGVTIFRLEKQLDAGPVIAALPLLNQPGETCGQYLERLTAASIPLLMDCLENPPTPQAQQGAVTFAPKISQAEAKLDFSQSAISLERKILGLNPEPGAWCIAGDARLKVLKAGALGATNWSAIEAEAIEPGRLIPRDRHLLVGCGDGTLLQLNLVQPSGRREMPAADWYRGLRGVAILE